jgi:hypothetical protein
MDSERKLHDYLSPPPDARRALELQAPQRSGASDDERAWLERYKAMHANPLDDPLNDDRGAEREFDLTVPFIGIRPPADFIRELGHGNVNVAGGWCYRLGIAYDDSGEAGFLCQLDGLDAFCEAMGLEPIADSGAVLGPFHTEREAWDWLARRMLATLVEVSKAALATRLTSRPVVARQEAAFDERVSRGGTQ